jgi:hypothetical protein
MISADTTLARMKQIMRGMGMHRKSIPWYAGIKQIHPVLHFSPAIQEIKPQSWVQIPGLALIRSGDQLGSFTACQHKSHARSGVKRVDCHGKA